MIRVAGPADFPALERIFVDAIQIGAAQHYDGAQRAAWSQRAEHAPPWEERLVQLETRLEEDASGVLGFLSFTLEGHVDLLFTAPRAARQGVATRLWMQVESELRAAGVSQATTHASRVARPFFERQGFEVQAPETVEVRGVALERFALCKSL